MKQYISKAKGLLDEIWQDKNVSIVEKTYSFGKSKFCLIDISLNAYGQKEDQKYIHSGFYRENLRRGNTLIENCKSKVIDWGRKGTPKILDIKLDHLAFFHSQIQIAKQNQHAANIIFEGVNAALGSGKKVELIRTEKVNGENAQVSYHYDLDKWLICSKNVSLLASTPDDLHRYKDQRYKFALLIAEEWFESIKNLKKGEIKDLKKLLDGYTIVGEYCGNPEHQHMVRYDKQCIKWFAMIDNYSEEYCIDPYETQRQLKKFGFKVVKMKSVIVTTSKENFYRSLESLFLKTAEAGIEDEEYGMQGLITYFLVHEIDKNGKSQQRTVGAAKLKSLEYRFFRKIRQKLSNFINKKDTPGELIRKFKLEIEQLEKENRSRTPFPHQYYVKVLKGGIEVVENSQITDQVLRGKFHSVLKMIFYSIHKHISLKKWSEKMLGDQNFIEKVSQIQFGKYNGLQCSTKIIYIPLCLAGMFKSYLGKKILPHFQKLQISYTIHPLENNSDFSKLASTLASDEKGEKPQSALQHVYLDGCFDIENLFLMVNEIKNISRHTSSYFKFILIKDQIKNEEDGFIDESFNKYPFRIQTIFMNYYGQYQHCHNQPKIQSKIDSLKKVTQGLKKNRNFNESIGSKIDLQGFEYPFSKATKFESQNSRDEFQDLVKSILKLPEKEETEKEEFTAYCRLILCLQKKAERIGYLEEEEVNKEIEHLIKSSYPSIPRFTFKK